MISSLILFVSCSSSAGTSGVWGTTGQANVYQQYNLDTGVIANQVPCKKGCFDQQQQRMSALDQESSVFYTIRDKQGFVAKAILHGFNLGTSTLACEAPLPFKQFAGSFGAGVYGVAAKGGGQVLVLGPIGQYAKQDFRHQLLQIDAAATPPTTKVVASIDRLYQPNAGSSTYDASNGVFYTMVTYEEGVEAVAGISVLTGNLVYLTPTTLYTIDFHNGLLLGFGFGVQIDPSNNQPYQIRTLATLNPKNNATAVLMNLTGYATNLPPTVRNRYPAGFWFVEDPLMRIVPLL